MIVFSRHSRERYAQRVAGGDFDTEVARGRLQMQIPHGLHQESARTDAWYVCARCVFPLQRSETDWMATTCLPRPHLSKAERRARRDLARDEDWRALS